MATGVRKKLRQTLRVIRIPHFERAENRNFQGDVNLDVSPRFGQTVERRGTVWELGWTYAARSGWQEGREFGTTGWCHWDLFLIVI